MNADLDEGARKGCDITAVLPSPGVEARVPREVVGEVESVHVGKVRDFDRECGGPDARGLDEVLRAVTYR